MQNENIVKELRQYMKVKADEAIMSKFKSYQKICIVDPDVIIQNEHKSRTNESGK